MANLAIKGHPERKKEVIRILEMLGGKMKGIVIGNDAFHGYYINSSGNIDYKHYSLFDDATIFTLEEFLKKYPYKVGDKVYYQPIPQIYNVCISEIISMKWINDSVVYYTSNGHEVYACDLQPYKEETMEENINDINKKDREEIDIIEPTTEINLNHPCFDEHNEIELIIPNGWKFEQRGDKMFGIRKQYPKTYEECCDILDIYPIYNKPNLCICEWHPETREMHEHYSKLANLSQKDIAFMTLRICRNAYWKIAGGWKPDWSNGLNKFCIAIHEDQILICSYVSTNFTLAFPTEEMRDAFYENFKDLIEQCKELL